MKRCVFASVVAALLLSGCATEDTARYSKAARATVLVESSHGYGTGFIIRRANRLFIFTAAHVVRECNDLTVHQEIRHENRKVGESIFSASVIARDEKADLAVLWLDAPADYFGHVEFDLGTFLPGTPVYSVGNFYGPKLPQSFSTGVISQLGVHPTSEFPWPIADQMTCLVINGSSGGPVFDYSDRVIGVVVGTFFPGIEFFVPLRAVESFAKENSVRWLLHGFWCPTDAQLSSLKLFAKYVAPEPKPDHIIFVSPTIPDNSKPKTKTK